MTSFTETDHPRAVAGTFTDKIQGSAEISLERRTIVAKPTRGPRTEEQARATVWLRYGHRELDDATALSIASFADPEIYSALHGLSANGTADAEEVLADLRAAYPVQLLPHAKQSIDMLSTWVLNGGDNSLTDDAVL
jgi:hypothetical protein